MDSTFMQSVFQQLVNHKTANVNTVTKTILAAPCLSWGLGLGLQSLSAHHATTAPKNNLKPASIITSRLSQFIAEKVLPVKR